MSGSKRACRWQCNPVPCHREHAGLGFPNSCPTQAPKKISRTLPRNHTFWNAFAISATHIFHEQVRADSMVPTKNALDCMDPGSQFHRALRAQIPTILVDRIKKSGAPTSGVSAITSKRSSKYEGFFASSNPSQRHGRCYIGQHAAHVCFVVE